MLIADSTGRFVDANTKACDLTGYSRAELLELTAADTYPEEDRPAAVQRLARLRPGESVSVERWLQRKDGSRLAVELILKRLADGRAQGVLRDITQRKHVDDRLRWLTLAIAQSPAAVIITDPRGNIEYVNEKFLRATGYAAEDVLGRNPRLLQS
ncbi:MAG TPA: PAS domain S-box protein, partial [Gemmatimonadales bacterium]|nr:PAS domain S-box protein [Gemmatimonadales bacterium]